MTTIATTPVVVLAGRGEDVARVGGKGWWLDRLRAEGFPVPPTAVVTTEAYRAVVAAEPVATLVAELRRSPPVGRDLDAERRRVDEAFAAVPLPAGVAAALPAAVAAVRSSPDDLVALRSSATAEDLHGTSFAGQYVSFLELRSPAEIERAARRVWASLWYPAPRAYRRHHHLDESDLAMAVIVMRMVPARCAGVAFTVDPAGDRSAVRVETVKGLGEALVSGRTTPTVRLVPRSRAAEVGRDEAPDTEVALAEQVAALALEVEHAFGEPQDVEWARDDATVWLLQARPVTAVAARAATANGGRDHDRNDSDRDEGDGDDGFDTPGRTGRRTTAGIAELLPGRLPPLQWTTVGERQDDAFRRLFADLGALPPADDRDTRVSGDGPRRFVARRQGRAALDLDALDAVATALGAPPGEVERRYVGSPTTAGPAAEATRRPGITRDLRVLRVRHRALLEAETAIVAVTGIVAARPSLRDEDDAAVLAYRWRLAELLDRLLGAETAVATTAVAAYDRLRSELADRLDDPRAAEQWALRVTAPAVATNWLTRLARRFDRLLDDDDLVEALVRTDAWDAAAALLADHPAGRRALVALDEALAAAGSRAVPGGPTWEEDPGRAWPPLRAELARRRAPAPPPSDNAARAHRRQLGPHLRPQAGDPTSQDWRVLVAELRRRPGWRRTRILTGQVIDVRLLALRRAADDAIEALDRRERAKQAVLALGGELRRVHLELGNRLVALGVLRQPGEVDLLGEAELGPALSERPPDRADLDRRRRCWPELDRDRPSPARTAGTGPPAGPTTAPGAVTAPGTEAPTPAPTPVSDAPVPDLREDALTMPAAVVLHGWSAGPGVARGRARVCTSASQPDFAPGDVLVARHTDASWSPLFLQAAAIVVEEGGPLSHAAILARELGIPAVVKVPGVVDRLAGRTPLVVVDGDHGSITVVETGEVTDHA